MFFKSIWLLISILPCFFSYAQESTVKPVTDITRITVLSPGVSYEKAIGNFQTLLFYGYASTSMSFNWSSSFGFQTSLYVDPAFEIDFRHYYYRKRKQKGKRIEMNSLNYLAATFRTTFSKQRISVSHFDESRRRPMNILGAVWGMQRNYKRHFSLDLQLGIGALYTKVTYPDLANQIVTDHELHPLLITDITLGFWLNKRKE